MTQPEHAMIVRPEQSIAKSPAAPSVAAMLQAVIEKGVTGENVKALESIVGLYERMEARDAQRAFSEAFNALQAEIPKVKARKAVPNSDGTCRYKFAPYEDIMDQVSPLLLRHGFSVDFTMRYDDGRLIMVCTLTHVRGHSKSNEFAVRVGKGPPGSTETQADGAAGTYAKRFALCNALNITIEQEMRDDPRNDGGTITQQQADELERRVAETNSNRAAFLKLAGDAQFSDIRAGKYDVLDNFLRMKEAKGR